MESITLTEFASLLTHGNHSLIHQAICEGLFDRVIDGMSRTSGCSQGTSVHLEGDVAQHTAIVVSNLVRIGLENPEEKIDVIDLLAALMHDVEKATTRMEDEQGNVSFPGHEEKAANRVPDVAAKLALSIDQQRKLDFLVREHGNAHSLPYLVAEEHKRLASSEHWRNLKLLQKADAMSCYLNSDGSNHLPVHWELFDALREKWAF